MYVNRVGETDIDFFLSNDPRDEYNSMLITEAALDPSMKRRIRFFVGENSKTFDLGEVTVTRRLGSDKVRLERCPETSPLLETKVGPHFKHPSEERAHSLLKSLFLDLVVLYEPFSLNFAEGVYCVDFVIRGDGVTPTSLVGVEVKSCIGAWYENEHANAAKIRMYHKLLNTECFVLVMEPSPVAFQLETGVEIKAFESLASFSNCVRADLGLKTSLQKAQRR